jgi:hypothetical protein
MVFKLINTLLPPLREVRVFFLLPEFTFTVFLRRLNCRNSQTAQDDTDVNREFENLFIHLHNLQNNKFLLLLSLEVFTFQKYKLKEKAILFVF